ncbi:MAG: hypothetical protein ABSG62_21430 [Terracidiphilus sp.]|jgi:hypothetical protein
MEKAQILISKLTALGVIALSPAGQWWRIRTIFGPRGSPSRQSGNRFLLVQSANPAATPYLYLTA